MRKPATIQITIPDPCHQNWDEMTPTDNGRFCSHCSKTVIDFTAWSDAQLYHFFAKHTGPVCGRFCSTQLSRPIAIPYQPHSRLYRITAALGLTLLVAQSPQVVAQNKPPVVATVDIPWQPAPHPGNGTLKGIVLDEHKEPMISAVIQVLQNGVVKGGSITDIDGNYSMSALDTGNYDILVLYQGYDTIASKVEIKDDRINQLNFIMDKPLKFDTF